MKKIRYNTFETNSSSTHAIVVSKEMERNDYDSFSWDRNYSFGREESRLVYEIDEKIAYLCDMGFKGIKLHPDYQDTFFDDEKYIEIIKSAKKYGLITLTHAGLDAAYIGKEIKCTPDRVLRVLDKVGGYPKLVLAHLGGFGGISEVCEKLAGLDVYFDTAYVLSFTKREDFLYLLEKHGDDKILFASDSPWQSIKDDVERVKALGLEESSERKIFSENARKLLGI